MWPVGVLAVLSTIAGFLQVPGGWALRRHLARSRGRVGPGGRRRARRLLDPRLADGRRRWHRRRLGRLPQARRALGGGSRAASRAPPRPRAQVLLRRGLRRSPSTSRPRPSRPGCSRRTRGAARPPARSAASAPASATCPAGSPPPRPGGCAHTSSPLAVGLAVLRHRLPRWSRDHDDPDPRSRSPARSRSGSCRGRAAGRRRVRAARRARRARPLGRGRRSTSTSTRPAFRIEADVSLVLGPRRRLQGRLLRLLALAGRPDRRRHGAPRSAYGLWPGASGSAPTSGLLLFLEGATIGVFAAQDLLLFYVFFEAMLIPLYVLIGVWGGAGAAGRRRSSSSSTRWPAPCSCWSRSSRSGSRRARSTSTAARARATARLDLPRLRRRVRRQGAALALPRLAARRLPRVAARGGGAPLGRDLEDGGVRLPPHRRCRSSPRPVARLAHRHPRARVDRARLRLAARVPRARRARRHRLLEPRADVPDRARALRRERLRPPRRAAADGQPRSDLGRPLPARRLRSSGGRARASFALLGGHGARAAACSRPS